MIKNKKILTIQDISCYGQCSLTVALPILSACGVETVILPSAVLSTHTGGFTGFTFRDLTDDMPKIAEHWEKEGISFDGVYTGYLGSTRQIGYVLDIMAKLLKKGGMRIVDPAMADNGKLYYGFDMEFVANMKKLCATADIVLPNITEACFLTDTPYRESYDEKFVNDVVAKLVALGAKSVVMTGIGYTPDTTGVLTYSNGKTVHYVHEKAAKGSHGTGDVYASAFTGALASGKDIFESAKIAADYTLRCILATQDDDAHRYGVKFEPLLGTLIDDLK